MKDLGILLLKQSIYKKHVCNAEKVDSKAQYQPMAWFSQSTLSKSLTDPKC